MVNYRKMKQPPIGPTWMKIALVFFFIFISGLIPLPASAAGKTIGVILTGDTPYYKDIHKSFVEGLAAEGFGSDQVEIIMQSPVPSPMSWTNAVRKLVAFDASVIISYGAPATLTATNETSGVPIVFAGVYDPEAVGISRRHATGVSSRVPISSLLKNLKSISNYSKLGVIFSSTEKDTVVQSDETRRLEEKFGFSSVLYNIKNPSEPPQMGGIDALFLTTSCSAMHCIENIVDYARQHKIPTASTIGGGEDRGIIITLAANPQEQGREAASLAAKVMKGSKPSELPVVSPKKVDLIINFKEASAMGIKIPFDLLTSATKVIK